MHRIAGSNSQHQACRVSSHTRLTCTLIRATELRSAATMMQGHAAETCLHKYQAQGIQLASTVVATCQLTNKAIQRQSLSENQDQDHTHEQLGLLCVSPAAVPVFDQQLPLCVRWSPALASDNCSSLQQADMIC